MTANVVLLVTLRHTARHKCSIGLRSGLTAGYSILFTSKFWRYSSMICALWWQVLSSWRMALGAMFRRYGIATGSRMSSRYLTVVRFPSIIRSVLTRDRYPTPHHDTAPSKTCHSVSTAISIAFSSPSSHFILLHTSADRTVICQTLHFPTFASSTVTNTCDWH